MRLFVALDIPQRVRTRIAEFAGRIRPQAPNARWARVEGLHVTLKFIGEVPEARLPEITQALASVKAPTFHVKFESIGFFPSPRSPRVFWIGVHAGEELPQLAESVDRALVNIGFPPEDRPYSPHLTLARAGTASGASQNLKRLPEFLATEATAHFGTMTAEAFFLYRSKPGRGGSQYTKLERFALVG